MKSPITYSGIPAELQAIVEKIPTVSNQAIQADEKTDGIPDMDFSKASGEFWRYHDAGKHTMVYVTGKVAGSYNKRQPSMDVLFSIYMLTVRNAIQNLASLDGTELSAFEPYFKNLQLAQELLSEKLSTSFKKSVDGEAIFAYVHGMLNTFVEKNINKN